MATKHTIESLKSLPESHRIIWDVTGEVFGKNSYKEVVLRFRLLCWGVEDETTLVPPFTVMTMPVSVKGTPEVFIVVVIGKFEGDIHFELLFEKISGYLLAVWMNDEWYEVVLSSQPIKGAKRFGFVGNYGEGECGNKKGLGLVDYKIGVAYVIYSLRSLSKDIHEVKPFLSVCLHLPEAARSLKIYQFLEPVMSIKEHILRLGEAESITKDSEVFESLVYDMINENDNEIVQTNKKGYFTNDCKEIVATWGKRSDAVLMVRNGVLGGNEALIKSGLWRLKESGVHTDALLNSLIAIVKSPAIKIERHG